MPLIGRLLLNPTDRHRAGSGATHMAELIKHGAAPPGNACKMLFNPVIERVDERGFILSGYEIVMIGTDKHDVDQVWLVRPLTAADPPTG